MRISLFNLSAPFFLMIVVLGRWEISATETTAGAATNKGPNVLLIYTDDHAQWAVGAYGNKDVHNRKWIALRPKARDSLRDLRNRSARLHGRCC